MHRQPALQKAKSYSGCKHHSLSYMNPFDGAPDGMVTTVYQENPT